MSEIDMAPVGAHSPVPRRRRGRSRLFASAIILVAALITLNGAACSRGQYTKVTRTDGTTVIGTLVAMRPDVVVIKTRVGQIEIRRSDVRSLEEPTLAEITHLETGASAGGGAGGANATNQAGRDNASASSGQQAQGGSNPRAPNASDGSAGASGAAGAGADGTSGAGGPSSAGGVPGSGTSSGAGSGSGTYARNDGAPSGRAPGGSATGGGASSGGTTGGASGNGARGSAYGGAGGSAGQSGGSGGTAYGGTASGGGGAGAGREGGTTNAAGRVAAPGEVVIPSGTTITVAFDAALSSDTARVEQPVGATVKSAVVINGTRIVPAGARLTGRVTEVASARAASGRGRIGIRFHTLTIDTRAIAIDAPALPIVAQVFTREDKRKVGWGAAAGAVLGGIVSGTKKGLGIGAAAGAGGTAAAVGLRNDVRIAAGTPMRLQLTQAVFVPAP